MSFNIKVSSRPTTVKLSTYSVEAVNDSPDLIPASTSSVQVTNEGTTVDTRREPSVTKPGLSLLTNKYGTLVFSSEKNY